MKAIVCKTKEFIGNEYFKFYLVSISLILLVGMLFFRNVLVSLILMPCLIIIKKIFKQHIEDKIDNKKTIYFKDLLYFLSSSFNLGRDLSRALLESEESMGRIYKKSEWIIKELKNVNLKINEGNLSDKKVVLDFACRSKNKFILDFFNNYFLIRDSGFPTTVLVDKQIKLILEKIRVDSEIKMILSKKRNESKILLAFPIVLLFLLNVFASKYLDILYNTILGNFLMAVCLGLIITAFFISERIIKIRY